MTLTVIQTAAASRPEWIESCLSSVRHWANHNQFQYYFAEDEIKQLIDDSFWRKTASAPQAGFDLLRLAWMRQLLNQSTDDDVQFCMWLDADVLIINPDQLTRNLPWDSHFAVGRENWLDRDGNRFRIRRHVHNAVLWANNASPVLPFYEFAAERVLRRVQPPFVPQLIGPKLLSSWHNIVEFDVLECCTMVSPDLMQAIQNRNQKGLQAYAEACKGGIAAVNLCSSLVKNNGDMTALVAQLQENAQQTFGQLGI